MECTVSWTGASGTRSGMGFVAETGSGHVLTMDGAPDAANPANGGQNLAPRPMETLLAGAGEALLAVGAVAQIVMTLWSLTVRGAIYQHTLEIERWKGVLLALTPLFAVMVLTILLFPELLPAPPPQV